jgi:hypothetical protein
METHNYSFEGEVWLWNNGKDVASWHFVTIPKDLSIDLGDMYSEAKKGFGSLKVQATVGSTTWQTSIFPQKEERTYILPIKKSVRVAENIEVNSRVAVDLGILID